MITIKEMLELSLFKNATLISGKKGINKPIRWITILELLDDVDQLDSEELLLTTAFDLTSNKNLINILIKKLHFQGVSAIVIQTGYYLESIPKKMIDDSNYYNFPIIEISKSITFSEITKIVHKHIINTQFEKIQYSESVYSKLTEIAIKNEGLYPIAKVVSELINGRITILDINLNELCSVINPLAELNLPEDFNQKIMNQILIQNNDQLPELKIKIEKDNKHVLITAVKSNNNIYGYIIGIKNSPFNDFEEIAIHHASTISTLEFIKLLSLEEKDKQLRSDFLELVLMGNYTDELTVYTIGETLGYKIDSQDTCVAIIKIDGFDDLEQKKKDNVERKLQQSILKLLQDHALKTFFKQLNGKFIVLITNFSINRINITRVLNHISDEIMSLYDVTLSIGIGNYFNNFNEYRYSFKEAQEALFIIESVWKRNKRLHYKDLGLYKLLLPLLQNEKLIKEYHQKVLGELLEYDELLETLRIYLEEMKINEAADKLFIHRHTLKYRIKKIETITNREINNFKDRIELELALIIHNILSV